MCVKWRVVKQPHNKEYSKKIYEGLIKNTSREMVTLSVLCDDADNS